jgi:hypothetical protein
MRRLGGHGPELLVVLGMLLGVGVVVALLVTRHQEHAARPPVPSTTPPSTPTTTAPPPTPTTTASPPPAIPRAPADLRVASLTSSTATLTWTTAVPTVGRVAVGTPALGPTRWLPPTPAGIQHEVTVSDLSFSTGYRAWVTSAGVDAGATVDFEPPAPTGNVTATTRDGAILVNGSPWIPLMVYGACSTFYPSLLADGITLFAQNACGGLEQQLPALSGRALSAGLAGVDDAPTGAGRIGAFLPDEADASGARGKSLPVVARPGLALLTLSSHVFSEASPPPGGRGIYGGLISRTDVVGFDLYPLQGWCRRDQLIDVYTAQVELDRLAGPRPTFQWIEAAGMNCPTDPSVAVTPDTVRAEAWLALAGGARGLGFFPAAWTGDVGGAIARVAGEVGALLPALTQPALQVDVQSDTGLVRAAAWSYDNATYVAAVNAGSSAADMTLRMPGLGSRVLGVLGENRTVKAADNAVTDRIDPLQVHLYAAAPS